ncbi:hypothetical protein [Streptomyces sp. NPDC006335]
MGRIIAMTVSLTGIACEAPERPALFSSGPRSNSKLQRRSGRPW